MLTEKQINHYAQASRVDSITAELDVILTYVLRILGNQPEPLLTHLAFKGDTSLKKIFYGKTGRFSKDLDFTRLDIKRNKFRTSLNSLLNNHEHYGISFIMEDVYESSRDSYGAKIAYSHTWNSGKFLIQVSFKEDPMLPIISMPLIKELYFRYCDFGVFEVPCLQEEEVLAEKIRASFQRIRARDVYDLYLFARRPRSYNKEKVKTLTVLKCWNLRDHFEPNRLFDKIAGEKYDWSDLQRLVSRDRLPSEKKLVTTVLEHYSYLGNLNKDLSRIVEDSKTHNEEVLVKKLIDKL